MAKPQPTRNLYDIVPARRRPFEERQDGTLDVLMPRYGGGRFGRMLAYFLNGKPVRLHLDDVGASVWRLCDGQRSIRDIGVSLQKQFGGRIEPVYDRLDEYLKHMARKGLIDWQI